MNAPSPITIMKTHYCISELAAMKLPRWPSSRQGWHEIATREDWPFVEVKISGGTGVQHYYQPSHDVMLAIAANTEEGKALLSDLLAKHVVNAVFGGKK